MIERKKSITDIGLLSLCLSAPGSNFLNYRISILNSVHEESYDKPSCRSHLCNASLTSEYYISFVPQKVGTKRIWSSTRRTPAERVQLFFENLSFLYALFAALSTSCHNARKVG